MNQDKIKQAFEKWLNDKYTKDYGNRSAWLAACEWIMSQGEKDFEAWWDDIINQNEGLPDYIEPEEVWQAARLSCAKELSEKDERIAALEGELARAYPKAKGTAYSQYELEQIIKSFPLAAELASKKEG